MKKIPEQVDVRIFPLTRRRAVRIAPPQIFPGSRVFLQENTTRKEFDTPAK